MAKSKDVKRIAYVQDGSVLRWTFSDGYKVEFDSDNPTVSASNLWALASMHGFKQKIADSAALSYKQADGTFRKPTDAEKREAMQKTVDALYAGSWNAARESTGGMLFRAMQEYKPGKFATVAEFDEWVAGQADAAGCTKAAFRLSLETGKRLGPIIERMKAAVAADVDSDDVLDNM